MDEAARHALLFTIDAGGGHRSAARARNPNRENHRRRGKTRRTPVQEIQAEVERICGGKPALPNVGDTPIAVVKWVDGTVLDTGDADSRAAFARRRPAMAGASA